MNEFKIYQIKQNYIFDKTTKKYVVNKKPYVELIAYGKSDKKLKDFVNIAWDLCNVYCWDNSQMNESNKFCNIITKNNIDIVLPIYETFTGVVASDIYICNKTNPTEYFVADMFGWKIFNNDNDAKKYIINNSIIFK